MFTLLGFALLINKDNWKIMCEGNRETKNNLISKISFAQEIHETGTLKTTFNFACSLRSVYLYLALVATFLLQRIYFLSLL